MITSKRTTWSTPQVRNTEQLRHIPTKMSFQYLQMLRPLDTYNLIPCLFSVRYDVKFLGIKEHIQESHAEITGAQRTIHALANRRNCGITAEICGHEKHNQWITDGKRNQNESKDFHWETIPHYPENLELQIQYTCLNDYQNLESHMRWHQKSEQPCLL